jgi:Tfp pilus assembly protein PilO
MRFNLWKKEGILPLALALLVLGAASYLLLFAPELRTIRSLKAEAAAKDAEVTEALQQGAAVAEFRRGEAPRWMRRLRAWRERVPSSPATESLLAEIGELAVRRNLKAFGLTMPAEQAAVSQGGMSDAAPPSGGTEGLAQMRLRLTFHSSYRDLAEFLDSLSKMRRLLTVRSVEIREKEGAMSTVVELSAWYRRLP